MQTYQSQRNRKEINTPTTVRSSSAFHMLTGPVSFDGVVETSRSEAMRSEQRVQHLVARRSKLQRKHANHSYM